MTVLIVILCVCVLALLLRSVTQASDLGRYRVRLSDNYLEALDRISTLERSMREVSGALPSATGPRSQYAVYDVVASLSLLSGLAEAAGVEFYNEQAKSGWRKRAKG